MINLPLEFTGSGDVALKTFKQIKREGQVAIYSVNETKYEVIFIKQQQAHSRTFPGGREVAYEAKELYPNTNEWGTNGFAYNTLEVAITQFDKLCAIHNSEHAIQGNG